MIYAINNNEKIKASPGVSAKCPCCDNDVIAKCGDINIWHWAHKTITNDCDYKPETDWHRRMKSLFSPDMVEIRVENSYGVAIADVLLPDGTALEFQHSQIDIAKIQKRELIHKKILWIFDVSEQYLRGQISLANVYHLDELRYRRPKSILSYVNPLNTYLYLEDDYIFKPFSSAEKSFIMNNATGYNDPYLSFTGKAINEYEFLSDLPLLDNDMPF